MGVNDNRGISLRQKDKMRVLGGIKAKIGVTKAKQLSSQAGLAARNRVRSPN